MPAVWEWSVLLVTLISFSFLLLTHVVCWAVKSWSEIFNQIKGTLYYCTYNKSFTASVKPNQRPCAYKVVLSPKILRMKVSEPESHHLWLISSVMSIHSACVKHLKFSVQTSDIINDASDRKFWKHFTWDSITTLSASKSDSLKVFSIKIDDLKMNSWVICPYGLKLMLKCISRVALLSQSADIAEITQQYLLELLNCEKSLPGTNPKDVLFYLQEQWGELISVMSKQWCPELINARAFY